MADDPLRHPLLQIEVAVAVRLQQPVFRQAGHPRHGARDVVAGDLAPAVPADARAGQVDGRERLVGEEPVADVAGRQLGGGLQGVRGEADAVVGLVPGRAALQRARRLRRRRLADQDRGETALERRVALDVLAILVVGGRPDAGELSPGEGRFQLVGRVLRSLARRTGADQHVQLVDEDHHPAAGALHLVLDPDQALAERSAKLRARHQAAHVQLQQDPIAAQHPVRQPFHDGRLSHTWLAHQDRVVRAAFAQDVEDLFGLALPPERGVQLPLRRQRGEIAGRRGSGRGSGSALRSGSVGGPGGIVATRVPLGRGAALAATAARAVGAATIASRRRGIDPVR